MRTWLHAVTQNRWLIVPPALALLYGAGGLLLGLASVLTLVALAMSGPPAGGLGGWPIIVLIVVVLLAITTLLLALARGFWDYASWAPGTALLLHGLVLAGQLLTIWDPRSAVRQPAPGLLILNALVIACLLLPPVRRLFA